MTNNLKTLSAVGEQVATSVLYLKQLEDAAVLVLVDMDWHKTSGDQRALFKVLETQGLIHFSNGFIKEGPKLVQGAGPTKVQDRINKIISDVLGIALKDVHPDSSLADELGVDSLDSMAILMNLEEEFDIELPDEQAEQVSVVQDIYDLVDK